MIFPHYPPPFWRLPPALECEHFILHFALRNPTEGKGRASEGVRDRVLVLAYVDALEHLYSVMRSAPWNRDPPITDDSGKTHIYICNYHALTSDESMAPTGEPTDIPSGVPYIVLPSRCDEPTIQAELHKAAAEAVHEAAHVFNYTQRQFHELTSHAWKWFDEAFAVFMETHVISGNQDYFRYVMDWIDLPETPLDAEYAKYQAGMFVRYIAKIGELGPAFVNQVWTQSEPDEKPFEALARFLRSKGLILSSADPDVTDIFGSGYCLEPYFLWHHRSPSLAPDVFARYGERAVSQSWEMYPGRDETTTGMLDHLACRYYRYYVRSGVTRLRVELQRQSVNPAPLKGEMVIIRKNLERSTTLPLRASDQAKLPAVPTLSVELRDLDPDSIDHIVLVVSNCGLRAMTDDEDEPHDDQQAFTLRATAS